MKYKVKKKNICIFRIINGARNINDKIYLFLIMLIKKIIEIIIIKLSLNEIDEYKIRLGTKKKSNKVFSL